MDTTKMIKAYCLKTKEKNVPMHDAVITKTAKGGYMAGGNDGKGNKMAAIMSETLVLFYTIPIIFKSRTRFIECGFYYFIHLTSYLI
jgi:hypothetical protein